MSIKELELSSVTNNLNIDTLDQMARLAVKNSSNIEAILIKATRPFPLESRESRSELRDAILTIRRIYADESRIINASIWDRLGFV